MFFLKPFLAFSPDDSGGSEGSDVAEDSEGSKADSPGSNEDSAEETKRAIAKEAWQSREAKRRKELNDAIGRVNKLEESLSKLQEQLQLLAESVESNKGGRPPKEETKIREFVESINAKVDASIEKLSARITSLIEKEEEKARLNERRDLMKEAGASPTFIKGIEMGIINVPEEVFDSFDSAERFIKRWDIHRSTVSEDSASSSHKTDATRRSVPHRDEDVASAAIHDDKGRQDVSEMIAEAQKSVDKILDTSKILSGEQELSTSELTKVMEAAEKMDELAGSM